MKKVPRREGIFLLAALGGVLLVWLLGILPAFSERSETRHHLARFEGDLKLRKTFEKLSERIGKSGSGVFFTSDSEASQELGRLLVGKSIRLDREVLESGERSGGKIIQSQYSGHVKDLFDFLTELETHPKAFFIIEASLDREGDKGRLRLRLQSRQGSGT